MHATASPRSHNTGRLSPCPPRVHIHAYSLRLLHYLSWVSAPPRCPCYKLACVSSRGKLWALSRAIVAKSHWSRVLIFGVWPFLSLGYEAVPFSLCSSVGDFVQCYMFAFVVTAPGRSSSLTFCLLSFQRRPCRLCDSYPTDLTSPNRERSYALSARLPFKST